MKFWPKFTKITLAFIILFTWISPYQAQASGPWYVAPGGSDSNSCMTPEFACATIEGALANATNEDSILVAAGTYTGSSDFVLRIEKPVTLSGGWDNTFTTQNGLSVIDGQRVRRGIGVHAGGNVTIDHFVIQHGYNEIGGSSAISNVTTSLTLTNCLVQENYSNGPAIYSDSEATLTGCTLRRNESSASGSAIENHGNMTINNSAIYENRGEGASITNLNNYSVLILNNTTVSSNTGFNDGGGIFNQGTLFLNNSTVSGNTSQIAGGGIYNDSSSNMISLRNSILAGNTAPQGPDCYGSVTSAGYNLTGSTAGCNYSSAEGDLTGQDPGLGELIGPPGAPDYLPLLPGSPAIDAGNPAGCLDHLDNPLDEDQRGAARNGRCDIGAYEYLPTGAAAGVYAFAGSPQHVIPLTAYRDALQALVLDANGSPVSAANVTFTAPASGPSGTFAGGDTNVFSAQTNASGLATAAQLTANNQRGEFLVTAQANSLPAAAQFSLGNLIWYLSPTGQDSNDCLSPAKPCASFPAAMNKSSFLPGDSIYAAAGRYTSSTEIIFPIDRDLNVYGGWDPSFVQQSGTSTLDGQSVRLGVTVKPGVTAFLQDLTVENCFGSKSPGGIINYGELHLKKINVLHNFGQDVDSTVPSAGGVYNAAKASMTIEDSVIKENEADFMMFNDAGGIANCGTMTLTQVTIGSNTAYNGGIYNNSILHITQSSVTENSGNGPGGIVNSGSLEIINSSIVRNSSSEETGGISNTGVLTLTNSTVSNNIGGFYPYGVAGGIVNHNGEMVINSSTIAENQGAYAGGILFSSTGSGFVTLQNSLLARNQGNDGMDCNGSPLISYGYNLIGDTKNCTFQAASGDLLNKDAKMFTLIGSPEYHPLLLNSPAIDAGNPAGCTDQQGNLLASDQRGMGRIGRCDIGSYEYNPDEDVLSYAFLPCTAFQYCQSAFLDDFNNPNSGWPVGEDENYLLEYRDGEYRLWVKSEYSSIGATPGFKMADGTLIVDVQRINYINGSFGLLFGLSDDWRQFYSFEISNDDTYALFRYNEDANPAWTLLTYGESDQIHAYQETNRLKVVQSNGSISLYANGALLNTVSENVLTGLRRVGVISFTKEYGNQDLRFDNFYAYPAACNFGGATLQSQPALDKVMDRPIGNR